MTARWILACVAVAAQAAACTGETATTDDVRDMAIERMRSELGLPAGQPLEAAVWTGRDYDGEPAVCGTVSATGQGPAIAPRRFAARLDPLRMLVFENAHAPMVHSTPDKFPSWERLCLVPRAR